MQFIEDTQFRGRIFYPTGLMKDVGMLSTYCIFEECLPFRDTIEEVREDLKAFKTSSGLTYIMNDRGFLQFYPK